MKSTRSFVVAAALVLACASHGVEATLRGKSPEDVIPHIVQYQYV